MSTCPRCQTSWPRLYAIHNVDRTVAERVCEACVFDDVHAGRVKLRRKRQGRVRNGATGIRAKGVLVVR